MSSDLHRGAVAVVGAITRRNALRLGLGSLWLRPGRLANSVLGAGSVPVWGTNSSVSPLDLHSEVLNRYRPFDILPSRFINENIFFGAKSGASLARFQGLDLSIALSNDGNTSKNM